jgi:hypothetical protein
MCSRSTLRTKGLEMADIDVAIATRTLQAAGFEITGVSRHASHLEYECEREDTFGAVVRYTVVIAAGPKPPNDVGFANREAIAAGRTVVVVAGEGGPNWLSWNEFLAVLGGAVPSWRALADSYSVALMTASRNELPVGAQGEAWRLFEDAVGDGLEFMFGQRVKRMGGVHRFKPVSDVLALTPDGLLMLVDAKATANGVYQLERPKLRALTEYVQRQRTRQGGSVPVGAALIVAGSFEPTGSLDAICNEFMAQSQTPLALLPVETLLMLVNTLRDAPSLRSRIRWRHIFVRTGLISSKVANDELSSAEKESWSRDLKPERGNFG